MQLCSTHLFLNRGVTFALRQSLGIVPDSSDLWKMSCKIGAHASQHSFSNLPFIRSGPACLMDVKAFNEFSDTSYTYLEGGHLGVWAWAFTGGVSIRILGENRLELGI